MYHTKHIVSGFVRLHTLFKALGQVLWTSFLWGMIWDVDRDSSVGITTDYGLGGPGIESSWGGGDRPWRPPTYSIGSGSLSQGEKRPGRDVDHPTPFIAEIKERVELYFHFPSGSSWPVTEWILPFTFWGTSCNSVKALPRNRKQRFFCLTL